MIRCIGLMPLVAVAAVVIRFALACFAEVSVAATWIGDLNGLLLGSSAPSPTSPCRSNLPAQRMHRQCAASKGMEVETP